MGVHDLWSLLSTSAHTISLEELRGQRIAVDVSIWLNQLVRGINVADLPFKTSELIKVSADFDGDISSLDDSSAANVQQMYIIAMFHRLCKLLFYGIRPVIVFDGKTPLIKKATVNKRNQEKRKEERKITVLAKKLLKNQMQKAAIDHFNRKVKGVEPKQEEEAQESDDDFMDSEDEEDEKEEVIPIKKKDVTVSGGGFVVEGEEEEVVADSEEREAAKIVTSLQRVESNPIDVTNIDPEVFGQLPQQMKEEIISQLKEAKRRKPLEALSRLQQQAPDEFSSNQLKQFIGASKITKQLKTIVNAANAVDAKEQGITRENTIASGTIASDPTTQYVLFNRASQNAQPEAKVTEQTAENTINMDDYEDSSENLPPEVPLTQFTTVSNPVPSITTQNNTASALEITFNPNEVNESDELFTPDMFNIQLPTAQKPENNTQQTIDLNSSSDEWEEDDKQEDEDVELQKAIALSYQEQKTTYDVEQQDQLLSMYNQQKYLFQLQQKRGGNTGMVPSSAPAPVSPVQAPAIVNTIPVAPVTIPVAPVEPKHKGPADNTIENGNGGAAPASAAETAEFFIHPLHNNRFVIDDGMVGKGKKSIKRASSPDVQEISPPPLTVSPTPAVNNSPIIIQETDVTNEKNDKDDKIEEYQDVWDYLSNIEPVDTLDRQQTNSPERAGLEALQKFIEAGADEVVDEGEADDSVEVLEASIPPFKAVGHVSSSQAEKLKHDSNRVREAQKASMKATTQQASVDTIDKIDLLNSQVNAESRQLREELGVAFRRRGRITLQLIEHVKTLLQILGIPYVQSPYEADSQCGFLCRNGLVDGVITEDNDVFLFGAHNVYRHVFHAAKVRNVQMYSLEAIQKQLGINRLQLVQLALLLGSDYTDGVHNVGIVTATQTIDAFRTEYKGKLEDNGVDIEEKVLAPLRAFRDWVNDPKKPERPDPSCLDQNKLFKYKFNKAKQRYILPKEFPDKRVADAYLMPTVDTSEEPFTWGDINLETLYEYARVFMGWEPQTTERYLKPVLQRQKYAMPETWVKKQKVANIRSKRIKDAVKSLSGLYEEAKVQNEEKTLPLKKQGVKRKPIKEHVQAKQKQMEEMSDEEDMEFFDKTAEAVNYAMNKRRRL